MNTKAMNIVLLSVLLLTITCKEPDNSDNTPTKLSVAEFTATQVEVNPLTYEFKLFINLGNAEIKEVQWDFGDGNTESGGPSTTHAYLETGTFNLTAKVISNDDQSATHTYNIQYNEGSFEFDETVTYQTIEGFGGFGAEKVWWSGGPWHTENYLEKVIDEMGTTIIRTQIYWDGEPVNDNDNPDVINWDAFDFGPNSDNGKQFDFLKDLDDRNVKIFATVWTPPLWMKLFDEEDRLPNECYNCSCPKADPYPDNRKMCGGRLNPIYYDEFAEYLAAYVIKVKEEIGVDIYALNIQNEPMFANPFEANVLRPTEFADALRAVGQRFEQEGLPTLLFGPEHMGEYTWGHNIKYVEEILEDPTVADYLAFYAVHSYVDGVEADYGNAEGWTALRNLVTVDHDRQLWMTETSDGSISGWELASKMSKSLYLALKFGQISGWVYWAYADVVIENGELTKLGHAFKNFYKYIDTGSVMISSESPGSDLLALSFYHGESNRVTHVLINNSSGHLGVRIPAHTGYQQYTGILTSPQHNSQDMGTIEAEGVAGIPADGILTLYSN